MDADKNKYFLTVRETANLFGIGENKIRQMLKNGSISQCTLHNGNRCLINRKLFEQFLDETHAI